MTAILVAIIGGLLVGYILFLPPAERERLLFGDGGSGSGGSYGGGGSGGYGGGGVFTQYGPVLITRETPGTLRLLESPVKEHPLPTSTIYTAIQTAEVKKVDSAVVKNGVFARRDLVMEFYADRQSDNFLLSFNVDQAGHAPLQVWVNDHLVYERPVREPSPSPIPIPVDFLVEGTNTITMRTSDTGLAFWRSNTYLLHNVLISADVIDDSSAAAQQIFTISEEELGAFDSARIEFVPECDQKRAQRLIVHVNSRLYRTPDNKTEELPNVVYSGLPDCGVVLRSELSKDMFRVGENRVLFASQGGEYVISRAKVVLKLKQDDYPVYYFNLPREMYDSLDVGRGQLRVTITFADYRTSKAGQIVLNGFVQSFRTNEYAYQAVVDPGILTPGPNTIQVIPAIDRLDVAEVKIELV